MLVEDAWETRNRPAKSSCDASPQKENNKRSKEAIVKFERIIFWSFTATYFHLRQLHGVGEKEISFHHKTNRLSMGVLLATSQPDASSHVNIGLTEIALEFQLSIYKKSRGAYGNRNGTGGVECTKTLSCDSIDNRLRGNLVWISKVPSSKHLLFPRFPDFCES